MADFTPTDDWQDVPDGVVLPAGLQIQVDVSTGRKRARRAPEQPSNVIDFKAIPPAPGFEKLEEWAAEVARLAALPELEYERVRKEVAARLGPDGVRVSVLDKHVRAARPKDDEKRQGKRIELPDVEPWPDPVDGAELLDALVAMQRRFLVTSEHQLIALALWVEHTHCFEAWWISPKLLVKSATARCGKTRVFEVIERLVRRRLLVSASTCSSVFRVIEASGDAPPTLLMDEADALTKNDDEMRKLINAGQTRSTAHVMISVPCGDGNWESRQFSTWAPIALAGIGDQAVTFHDRSVVITMRRKTRDKQVEKLRGNKDYGFHALAQKCARWAADHVDALKDAEPAMPELLHDRAQDNWEPLIAIADAAGGDWPQRARAAAVAIQREVEELDKAEVGVQLLHDIADVFEGGLQPPVLDANLRGYLINKRWWCATTPTRRVTTAYLLARLHEMEERIWSTYGKGGAPLTDYELASLLQQFEVRSKQFCFTIDGKEHNWKGYEWPQFIYLLARYPKYPSRTLGSAENLGESRDKAPSSAEPPVTARVAGTAEPRVLEGQNGGDGERYNIPPPERLCLGCGNRLPINVRADREFCSDTCRKRYSRPTKSVSTPKPNGPEPGTVAGMPSMITRRMKADLKARGFSDAQIKTMTPEQAHAHLTGAAERCAHCGGELARDDMLPLNTGGHIHHRCADDFIGARDAARPRVDPELPAITHAMKARLRQRGVHSGVIRELRPEDAHRLLDENEPVPPNAARSPQEDLRKLAAILAGQDSACLARAAMCYAAAGIEISPETIDAIRAGGAVAYPVRDALWIALS